MSGFYYYSSDSHIYKAFYWTLVLSYFILIPYFIWLFFKPIHSYYKNYLKGILILVILLSISILYIVRIIFLFLIPILSPPKLLIITSFHCACYLSIVSIINWIFLDISISFNIAWEDSKRKRVSQIFLIAEGLVVIIYVVFMITFSSLGDKDWMINHNAFLMCQIVDNGYWGLLITVFLINTWILMIKFKKMFPDGFNEEVSKTIYSIHVSILTFLFFGLGVPVLLILIFDSDWNDTSKSISFFTFYFSEDIFTVIVLIFFLSRNQVSTSRSMSEVVGDLLENAGEEKIEQNIND